MNKLEKVSLEKHDGDVLCIAYNNNKIFSGGADGKVKIWDNDLQLLHTLDMHDAYIYALTVNMNGKVYTSSCDGSVKFVTPPYGNDNVRELFSCDDVIQAMYCDGDMLYTGDDKGVVTSWSNDKMLFKYNLVEEVKSLAVEGMLIYTVRDLDIVVSELSPGKSGKYSNKAVVMGKSPLALVGPVLECKHSFLAFADRTGKGLALVRNLPNQKFTSVWNLTDCHEMIVNSITGNDDCLYSGGYDKKVKGWTDLEQTLPKYLGEVDAGSCVNAICCGVNGQIFIGASDGVIRRAKLI